MRFGREDFLRRPKKRTNVRIEGFPFGKSAGVRDSIKRRFHLGDARRHSIVDDIHVDTRAGHNEVGFLIAPLAPSPLGWVEV